MGMCVWAECFPERTQDDAFFLVEGATEGWWFNQSSYAGHNIERKLIIYLHRGESEKENQCCGMESTTKRWLFVLRGNECEHAHSPAPLARRDMISEA